jgi:hypothetical protein
MNTNKHVSPNEKYVYIAFRHEISPAVENGFKEKMISSYLFQNKTTYFVIIAFCPNDKYIRHWGISYPKISNKRIFIITNKVKQGH